LIKTFVETIFGVLKGCMHHGSDTGDDRKKMWAFV
jgi:hypothetical protein